MTRKGDMARGRAGLAAGIPAIELDIACAVLRIEQCAREGGVMRELLLDRLINSDAPRLRKHLSLATLEVMSFPND